MGMARMIQIRNVPEGLHRTLKARAALEGASLSDYLLEELRRVSRRPTLRELEERLRGRTAVTPRLSPVDAVRQERAKR